MPFDKYDAESIIEYARKLAGKTLSENISKEAEILYGGKGSFGNIVEEAYFGYSRNSNAEADFKEAGLELKSSPLKKLRNGEYRAKERLVMNIINYFDIVNEDFSRSSFLEKNRHLLLIFYLYEKDKSVLDYLIKLVGDWEFPPEDLEVIRQDWQKIADKISAGRAHELSEGDTFYLGACTKGSNSSTLRAQPFNELKAMQRAFSLKQGYVNHIIAKISGEKQGYGKLIRSVKEVRKKGFEEIVISKFQKYYGKKISEILMEKDLNLNPSAKNFTANLTKALLGIELQNEIEEFEKAELIVKTVRLKENLLPKEDMSFPAFDFQSLVEETWENSEFKNILEHKFLIIFLKITGNDLVFDKVTFWNMPFDDIVKAKLVWMEAKRILKNGNIVKELQENRRLTNFPSKKFSEVAHIRPHAKDKDDTLPLPTKDKLTGLQSFTKQSFWLNSRYIRDEIFLKF